MKWNWNFYVFFQGTYSVSDEIEINLLEELIVYELRWPTTIHQYKEFRCFINLFRGVDLKVEIEFEGEDDYESYVIPGEFIIKTTVI